MKRIPTVAQAEKWLEEGSAQSNGGWVSHSRYVAQAAAAIARAHPDLDEEVGYVMGLLHDIGRQEGWTGIRHIVDGYTFMLNKGFPDVARICITHSFPLKNHRAAAGDWDVCTPEQVALVVDYLAGIEYDSYDHLLQLCDGLAMADGFTLLEKRMLDVVYRYGPNALTVQKWAASFALRDAFDQAIGHSIYECLPGVVENTFGFDPCNG